MPVNMGSAGDQSGNLAVWRVGQQLVCRVLSKDDQIKPGEWRGVNHWSTCIAAGDFKARQGWWHNPRRRRWEWRTAPGGPVVHWITDVRVQTEWEVAQQYAAECTGGELLPAEAKPSGQQGSLL